MLNKREILGGILIFSVVGIIATAAHHAGITLCLFRRLTGFSCPCCGTTRACLSLLRGDVVGALKFNPLAVVTIFVAPLFIWLTNRRKAWPRPAVITTTVLIWVAVMLNWTYLLLRDLNKI